MKKTELWFLAQAWVKSNHVLIWCIAAPYYKYMTCDFQDLEHEAMLTAYQVMSGLLRKNKKLLLMSRYYRVVFRTRCIKLTTGMIVANCDIEQLSVPDQAQKQQELDEEVIQDALQVLTNRQRQISQWILSQPKPVSTSMVAKKYGVQRRTIQAVLSNAIDRIKKYGHQPIRETITTAS
ncbi:MAG TPA: sigma-70 family RNA polymerase sigma factor [Phaeodactylibacter sp.]|nr:sigma-70 family RNA polymerase sigma factor [Phaeodactylibacter sp.]